MPDTTDLAALPTSWALTIWDALPIFLSISLALAVVITATLESNRRHAAWQLTAAYPLAGVAYLFVFDPTLALIAAIVFGVYLVVMHWVVPEGAAHSAPLNPLEAIRRRGGAIIWDVAKASAIAAVLKVVIAPVIEHHTGAWTTLAVVLGLVFPGPIGVATIPALSVWSASQSLVPPTVWLLSAALRPLVSRLLCTWKARLSPSRA